MPDDQDHERDRSRGPPVPAKIVEAAPGGSNVPYPYDEPAGSSAAYEYERLSSWRSPSPADNAYGKGSYRSSRDTVQGVTYGDIPDYRYEQPRGREERDIPPPSPRADRPPVSPLEDKFRFLPQKYATQITTVEPRDGPRDSRESFGRGSEPERGSDSDRDRNRGKDKKRDYDEDLAYGTVPGPKKESSKYTYSEVKPYEYEQTDSSSMRYSQDPRYSSSSLDPRGRPDRAPSPSPGIERRGSQRESKTYSRDSYLGTSDPRLSSSSVVTVEPGAAPRRSAMKGGRQRDTSPQPPVTKMSSLSVNTGHHALNMSLSAAPGSPLLESYHGTYQSMSPMPSPLMLPSEGPQIQTISPIGSDDERSGKRKSRRARFHDPEDDAARLAKALKGERRAPDTEPLIEILPGLTHDQVMDLRVEYKRLVKTGSEKRGVNIAKHIRARLKDEDPSLMKACYATALGQWESEAYWANFWYQGDKTRRELLIEALMGRTNDEIRAIKAGFSDKKYSNSLTKCMKTELKEDKFKKAVLMILDEQRMEEYDAYGRPNRIDYDLVKDDVKDLRRSVKSEKGGESAMISIVVQRSDTHLREVLRAYTDNYRSNFARDALKKSGNLVVRVLSSCQYIYHSMN